MLKRPRLDAEVNSGDESARQVVQKSVFADAQHEARWRQSAIRQAYEKARERELDELHELEREKEASRIEGQAIGKIEGKIEEKLKALPGIKAAIDSKIGHELLKQFFSSFEESTLSQIEVYVSTHQDCKVEDIAQEIGLIGSDGSNLT